MDPANYVTREMNDTMLAMANEIHSIGECTDTLLNMGIADISKTFNNFSGILYYAGNSLKPKSSVGFHSDCVCSPING